MKKLLLTLAFIQSAFAATIQDEHLAPAEYRKMNITFTHADCISSARIFNTLPLKAVCGASVKLSGMSKDLVFTSITNPMKRTFNTKEKVTLYLSKPKLACSAKVNLYVDREGKEVRVSFEFTKLTKMDHASIVMCSKRLIQKYGHASGKRMLFSVNYLAPSI